ncbi:MAG: chorismate synthase [Spirochaetaceae bacterium]|jgi:chorismate synthase|nr:chorismate synthase [Spirochaetaceae bacterium]
MSGNSFGVIFSVTTFGESHGPALGAVIDGCPPGITLDERIIQAELDRRRPGNHGAGECEASGERNPAVTPRKEADTGEILSGVFRGKTTGTPIAVLIRNTSQLSKDYDNIEHLYRPGHADFTYAAKYGIRDHRGGGRSSGRETAARVAAGAVAKQFLKEAGIRITAFTLRAAGVSCGSIDLSVIEQNRMRAADLKAADLMEARVAELGRNGDSAGGIVECRVSGVPAGLGEPVFDKLDAELAKAILSVGAVKGIEFGGGFEAADSRGSLWNDPIRNDGSGAVFVTNNAGGILGGISSGADIVFRAAIKPVPSIAKKQQTIDTNGNDADIIVEGRHDVCLCPRIVPVIEAMTAITLADMYLRTKMWLC